MDTSPLNGSSQGSGTDLKTRRTTPRDSEIVILVYLYLKDDRLNFTNVANFDVINGEDFFTDHIWTPNIFIENSRDSTLMRTTGDSTYVRILNTGEVELHYRLKTVVLCDMKLQRFPHDTQNCTIKFESCE